MKVSCTVVRPDDLDLLMEFNGGSLKGYVLTDLKTLCRLFGTPSYGPFDQGGDKVTCEWKIKTEEGLHVTIYDWKMGDTPVDEYEWHIGGHDFKAVDWVASFGLQARRWK